MHIRITTKLAFVWLAASALGACSSHVDEGRPGAATDVAAGNRNALTYEKSYYFEGLEEWVMVHKGVDGVWCKNDTPAHQDCAAMKVADRAAHRAKSGAMTTSFAKRVESADRIIGEESFADVRFAVAYPANLHDRDPTVKRRAQDELKTNIGAGAKHWEAWVREHGGTVTAPTTSSMPEFTVRGPPSLFRSLAWLSEIERINEAVNGNAVRTDTPTDAIAISKVDVYLNPPSAPALSGHGVKIGILGADGGTRLFKEHDVFWTTLIHEFAPPAPCDLSASPVVECPGDPANRICFNNQCVDVHESQVAGTIAVGRPSPGGNSDAYGAYGAEIYHWNKIGINTVNGSKTSVCNLALVREAYDWLLQMGVTVVNESFQCFYQGAGGDWYLPASFSVDGIAQDYYSRVYDMFITRAAGNDAYPGDPPQALACPHTLNSMCVGAMTKERTVTCTSNYRNPRVGETSLDREEPDIVALAGDADYCGAPELTRGIQVPQVSPNGLSTWIRSNGGTSFAAPQIAMFAALKKEECPLWGPLDLRTMFKLHAVAANPDSTAYSTPGLYIPAIPDYKDGAGYFDASTYPLGCGDPLNTHETRSTGPIDLSHGIPSLFNGDCPDCGKPLSANLDIHPLDKRPGHTYGTGLDNRLYSLLIDKNFVPGSADYLRVTANWSACTNASATRSPAPVGTDFDLFLLDVIQGHQRVVYSSQSNDDNSEGFDINLKSLRRPDGSSEWAVYVGWPSGAPGCDYTGYEPLSWSATWH